MRQFVQCRRVQSRFGSPAFTAASASRVSSCSDPNPGRTTRSATGNGARQGARRAGLEVCEAPELDDGPRQHEAPAGVEVGLPPVVDPAVVPKRECVHPEPKGRARMRTAETDGEGGQAGGHGGADSTARPPRGYQRGPQAGRWNVRGWGTLSTTLISGTGASLRHSAVDGQDLPRDVAGFVGCEERHGVGHLFRGPCPTTCRQLDDALRDLRRQTARQVGGDVTRRDGVDGDTPPAVFLRHRLREADNPGFCGSVVRLTRAADYSGERGDVDDAAVSLLQHLAEGGAAAVEHALEVLLDDDVEVLFLHRREQAVAGRSGVVDEDVETTVGGDGGLDDGLRGAEVAHVALHGRSLTAACPDARDEVISRGGALVVVDSDPGPQRSQLDRARVADAA